MFDALIASYCFNSCLRMYYTGYRRIRLIKDLPVRVIGSVIPAESGIQTSSSGCGHWIPAFAGMTDVVV